MSKTAPILDQTHTLIVNKQLEMKRKHRITMRISDIIDVIVAKNIHMLEKYMGINVEKEKSAVSDNEESESDSSVPSVSPTVEKTNT